MKAAVAEVQALGISALPGLLDTMDDYVFTNLSASKVLTLAATIFDIDPGPMPTLTPSSFDAKRIRRLQPTTPATSPTSSMEGCNGYLWKNDIGQINFNQFYVRGHYNTFRDFADGTLNTLPAYEYYSGIPSHPYTCDTGEPKDWFIDDNDSVFESDINWMAEEGITRGCNPPVNDRYCPDARVTRGQMAAFLVRALDLTDASTIRSPTTTARSSRATSNVSPPPGSPGAATRRPTPDSARMPTSPASRWRRSSSGRSATPTTAAATCSPTTTVDLRGRHRSPRDRRRHQGCNPRRTPGSVRDRTSPGARWRRSCTAPSADAIHGGSIGIRRGRFCRAHRDRSARPRRAAAACTSAETGGHSSNRCARTPPQRSTTHDQHIDHHDGARRPRHPRHDHSRCRRLPLPENGHNRHDGMGRTSPDHLDDHSGTSRTTNRRSSRSRHRGTCHHTSPPTTRNLQAFRAVVSMSANVSDPDGDQVTIDWYSSLSGYLGTGEFITASLITLYDSSQPFITARATDPHGASSEAAIQIIVWVPSDT